MQFLYKSDKISPFGQICQHEVSCRPGFVEQRTRITNGGGGCGGRSSPPPPFEKHGQRSEHTGFLTVHSLFCFASCLHYEIAGGFGGAQPPPICRTWTKIRTHISSCTPLMDACCSVFCDVAMCLDCEIFIICSMLSAVCLRFQAAQCSNLKHSFVAF